MPRRRVPNRPGHHGRRDAAAADPSHPRARVGEQPGLGVPATDGVLVAVRLGDHLHAGEVGRGPVAVRGEQFGEGAGRRGHPAGGVRAEQFDRVVPERGGARRLDTHDGYARAGGLVQLAGGDPGQTAADLFAGEGGAVTGVYEYGEDVLGDLGGEVFGEMTVTMTVGARRR